MTGRAIHRLCAAIHHYWKKEPRHSVDLTPNNWTLVSQGWKIWAVAKICRYRNYSGVMVCHLLPTKHTQRHKDDS